MTPKLEKKAASIKPMQDYLLVTLLPKEYDSPIQLPDSALESGLTKFRVLAVGPGKIVLGGVFFTPDYVPGDIVMLSDRGNFVEIDSPTPTLRKGYVGDEGGLMLITADSVIAKVLPDEEESN